MKKIFRTTALDEDLEHDKYLTSTLTTNFYYGVFMISIERLHVCRYF